MQNNSSNTIQAFWVGFGSLCSFGFSLISAAIISRYLTKDDYGTYKQVMYVYNTLLVVFTLGLPRAYSYFLPRINIEEGPSMIRKLNLCFLLLGIIFSGVLYLSSDIVSQILNNPNLASPLKIFSPTPIFLLPTMGLEGVLATYKRTQWNAIYSVSTRFLSILFVALPVIFYKAEVTVAVEGFMISSIITCIIGLYFMYLPFRGIERKSTTVTLKEIFTFSLPLMFAGFWGIAEKSADQFFISRWFGEAVFADFANGSLELPFAGMVLSAGAVVLLPLFSKMVAGDTDKREIIDLWRRTAVKAAYILYPLVAFSWFFADIIMTFLYGDRYEDSGTYFRIMLTINFFTIAQYYPILLALGKTRLYSNVLMSAAIAVWVFEYLSVELLSNPYLVSVVAIFIRILKIIVFLRAIALILDSSITGLVPFNKLFKIFATSIFAALISYFVILNTVFINYKIWQLTFGFIIFAILLLMFAKIFRVDYFNVITPLLSKLGLQKRIQ